MTRGRKRQVAVLIPAYNEETVIESTLRSIKRQVNKRDIYLVNDGSKDRTKDLAKRQIHNVLTTKNGGKARALNTGVSHFKLKDKYRYILLMDADTVPDKDYFKYALRHLDEDKDKKLQGVVGKVCSLGKSVYGKYRVWEYEVAHAIHKRAQANIKSIIVLPGCATVYRAQVLGQNKIPEGTVTEDMDYTFWLHRNNLANFKFEDRAKVWTQDPQELRVLVGQVKRWYKGFWQAVEKHDVPWGGKWLDFEVSILAVEGLFNGVICLLGFVLVPLALMFDPMVLRVPLAVDLVLFFIPTLVWASIKARKWGLIINLPYFYLLRVISSLLFLESFFTALMSPLIKRQVWQTKRYQTGEVIN